MSGQGLQLVDVTALELLDLVVKEMGGSPREGQQMMTAMIADALAAGNDVSVAAPTGSGKSAAGLVAVIRAAVLAGKRVLVMPPTRALQDQYERDLLVVEKVFADAGLPFDWVTLKGRANYVCPAAVAALGAAEDEFDFGDDAVDSADAEMLDVLVEWIGEGGSARADAPIEVPESVWGQVSRSNESCVGKKKCQFADVCPSEAAKAAARESTVTLTNPAWFAGVLKVAGWDSSSFCDVDTIVVDEAHKFPGIVASQLSARVSAGDVRRLVKRIEGAVEGVSAVDKLRVAAKDLDSALEGFVGNRVHGRTEQKIVKGDLPASISRALQAIVLAATAARTDVTKAAKAAADTKYKDQCESVQVGITALTDRVAAFAQASTTVGVSLYAEVSDQQRFSLCVADARVADTLTKLLWDQPGRPRLVAYSATLPSSFAQDVGLEMVHAAVPSPFPLRDMGVLFVPSRVDGFPSPKQDGWSDAAAKMTLELVRLAGERGLSLHTSNRQKDVTVEVLRDAGVEVIAQGDVPHGEAVERLRSGEKVVVVGVASWWEGVDVPGLPLVVVDRMPYPVPTDPVYLAKSSIAVAAAGGDEWAAFREVAVPACAATLAQGAGRLVRNHRDGGCVAVLDVRLVKAVKVLGELPPFRRVASLDDVGKFVGLRTVLPALLEKKVQPEVDGGKVEA